jgi:hypothetical protein
MCTQLCAHSHTFYHIHTDIYADRCKDTQTYYRDMWSHLESQTEIHKVKTTYPHTVTYMNTNELIYITCTYS